MTDNRFAIRSGWGMREDSSARLGERMLQFLDAIAGISPFFRQWWLVNLSLSLKAAANVKNKGRAFPLAEARDRMTEIVELGVDGGDEGEPTPETGYSLYAVNSPLKSATSVNVRARGGDAINFWGWRDAVFSTEIGWTPDPAIVAYQVFKPVLLALVSSWNVDYAQAFSSDLMKRWIKPSNGYLELAWMTYLSPSLAAQIQPPGDVVVERTEDGGLLMIAAEETFDVGNPKHIAGARCIFEAVAPLNAEYEKLWAARWPKRYPQL